MEFYRQTMDLYRDVTMQLLVNFEKGLYKLLPNGKIIRKLHRSKIKREKQKLRKLYKLHAPEKDIAENIVSWKGGLKGFNAYHSLLSIYKYNLKLRGVQK